MAITENINLAGSPYYDDFNEDKKYLRILFRPGVSVQARELTQLQTMMQKQVERVGRHMFKEGSMVVPGEIVYDLNYSFVKAKLEYSGFPVQFSELVGKVVKNSKDLLAKIIEVVSNPTESVYDVYLKYINSGSDGSKAFLPDDIISLETGAETFQVNSGSSSVGVGSVVSIGEGIFFSHGHFIKVTKHKMFLDAYSNVPSYRVGLKAVESIITSSDDTSLLSGAQGVSNYAAPGADRYKIDLVLHKIVIAVEDPDEIPLQNTSNDPDFIELLILQNGQLFKQVRFTEYAILGDTLARRTFDESGHYTVKPFLAKSKELLDTGSNGGLYYRSLILDNVTFNTGYDSIEEGNYITDNLGQNGVVVVYNPTTKRVQYILESILNFSKATPPAETTVYIQISKTDTTPVASAVISKVVGDDYDEKVGIVIEPGKAYVRGYEIEKLGKTIVQCKKARDSQSFNDKIISTFSGDALIVKNMYGIPDYQTFIQVYLKDIDTDTIGTCRIKLVEYDETSGSLGSYTGESDADIDKGLYNNDSESYALYFVYLSNVAMNSGKRLEDVKSLSGTNFSAEVFCNSWDFEGTVSCDGIPSGGQFKLVGVNTNFNDDVKVGDIFSIQTSDSTKVKKYRITQMSTAQPNSVLYFKYYDGTLVAADADDAFSNQPFQVEFAQSLDAVSGTLIFTAPDTNLKQFDSTSNNTDNNFFVRRIFDSVTPDGSNNITLTLLNPADAFVTSSLEETIIHQYAGDAGPPVIPANKILKAKVITFDPNTPDTLIVTLPDDALGGNYKISTLVKRGATIAQSTDQSAYWRGKQSVQYYFDLTANQAKVQVVRFPISTLTEKQRATDVYKIVNVWSVDTAIAFPAYGSADSAYLSAGCVDIKDSFGLNTGQTDNYYGYASLNRRSTAAIPNGKLRIIYKRYDRTNHNMRYYCVSSYPNYDEIPTYKASSGEVFHLRDCIDFRPDYFELDGGSAYDMEVPVPSYNFKADYSQYLSRIDSLILRKDGTFKLLEGNSAISPKAISVPSDAMGIYTVFVPAYTYKASDVLLNFIDNKRYTMRDIGKLEKRIDQVEFYTKLNLLEKEALEIKAEDPVTGFDLFREGMFVDSFSDIPNLLSDKTPTTLGNISSPDWKCSYETEKSRLRCDFEKLPIKIDPLTSEDFGPGTNLKLTSDNILMLKYTETPLIFQEFCTTDYPVNPYNETINIGSMILTPSTDVWTEEIRIAADEVVLDTGVTDAIDDVFSEIGKIYNDHQTTLTGKREETTPEKVPGSRRYYGVEFKDYGIIYFPPQESFPGKQTNKIVLEKLNKKLEKLGKKPLKKLPHPRRFLWSVQYKVATRTLTQTTSASGITVNVTGETIVKQSIGDKIVNSKLSLYIREKLIKFSAEGLKPNTRVYPFFDGVPVSNYCSTKTSTLPAGSHKTQVLDMTGSVLKTDDEGKIEGYFEIPDPKNSLSSASSPTIGKYAFPVGQRIFKLTDIKDNKDNPTTRAEADYYAQGLINTVQETIISTRTPIITTSPFTDPTKVTEISEDELITINRVGGWIDPVAQTFRVTRHPEGVLVSSIDIWFQEKPVNNKQPIRLEVRTVTDDESPSIKVLPFGRVVLYPEQIGTIQYYNKKIDGDKPPTTVPPSGGSRPSKFDNDPTHQAYGSTKFEFSTPLLLQNDTTYAFCLISDSDDYRVWIAKAGATVGDDVAAAALSNIILTPNGKNGEKLLKNIYDGNFFKSANAAKWESDQTADMKFRINKCRFFSSPTPQFSGSINLYNSLKGEDYWTSIAKEPIQLNQDFLNTVPSNPQVRIFHKNHGFRVQDQVRLYGVVGIEKLIGSEWFDINYPGSGSPPYSPIILGPFDITSVDLDSYIIETENRWRKTGQADYSGRCGGISVKATTNKKFDTLCPFLREIVPNNTSTLYDLSTLSYNTPITETQNLRITMGENIEFDYPQVITTPDNGGSIRHYDTDQSKSIKLQVGLQTTKNYICPLIDLDTSQFIAIAHMIDDKVFQANSINNYTIIDSPIPGIEFSTTDDSILITLANADDLYEANDRFAIGKYINVIGSVNGNNGPYLITKKELIDGSYQIKLFVKANLTNYSATPASCSIQQNDYYVDEIAPIRSSSSSKYVTTPIMLQNAATVLKVMMMVYKPAGAKVELYYRTVNPDNKVNIDSVPYTKLEPASERDSVGSDDLITLTYEKQRIPSFNSISFKIVLKKSTTSSSNVPYVTNFMGNVFVGV